ncbi:hypothetical protein EDD11_001240, partial [Mortierella claussenii]
KLIRFFQEDVLTRTTVKRTKVGADFKSQVGVRQKGAADQPDVDLLQMLKDAPTDRKGRKMIEVPLGVEAIVMARKAMIRIHQLQHRRNQVGLPGPVDMKGFNSVVQDHKERLYTQGVQSGQRRSADCVLRDSYTMTKFNNILTTLWSKERQQR